MNKSVEDYLKILYPNSDSLSEEELKEFEKDKTFLLEFFNEFKAEYNKYSARRGVIFSETIHSGY